VQAQTPTRGCRFLPRLNRCAWDRASRSAAADTDSPLTRFAVGNNLVMTRLPRFGVGLPGQGARAFGGCRPSHPGASWDMRGGGMGEHPQPAGDQTDQQSGGPAPRPPWLARVDRAGPAKGAHAGVILRAGGDLTLAAGGVAARRLAEV
jgi:hypothetical protein